MDSALFADLPNPSPDTRTGFKCTYSLAASNQEPSPSTSMRNGLATPCTKANRSRNVNHI